MKGQSLRSAAPSLQAFAKLAAMTHEDVVRAVWAAFDRAEFPAAAPHLDPGFVCEWPQSGERFDGPGWLAMNAAYPGRFRCQVERLVVQGDQVVTETRVSDGTRTDTALSWFTLRAGRIAHLREWWPDPMPPQAWRARWLLPPG